MKKQFHVAVVGASGMVGRQVLESMHELQFPAASVHAFASAQSKSELLNFGDKKIDLQPIGPHSFQGIDLAFFAVDDGVARQLCPQAVAAGVLCIDKSSAHRMKNDVPLVVPEVNPHNLSEWQASRIVASPNCVVIPLVRVLHSLRQGAALKRVIVCSYQAVSGLGKKGIQQLQQESQELLQNGQCSSANWPQQLAFNVLPSIPESGQFSKTGSSSEEDKVVVECRKILQEPKLSIEATCVRVPVLHGHSAAVHIEFTEPLSVQQAHQLLQADPGIRLFHNETPLPSYPTPVDVAGSDTIAVGRIRLDRSVKSGLILWLCSDNVRVGAAVNAVQTAKILCEQYWIT